MRIELCVGLTLIVGISGCDSGSSPATNADGAPAASDATTADAPVAMPTLARHLVSDDQPGPAYVTVADLNGDGRDELVVASLGTFASGFAGALTVYDRGADLDSWTATSLTTTLMFPNQPTVHDMDGDGDLDIVQPAGFFPCRFLGQTCGGIYWFEQTGDGWVQHAVLDQQQLFFHHVELADFNGDGLDDIVTVGEDFMPPSVSEAHLMVVYASDDHGNFEAQATTLGDGLGSFPRVRDIDGDGDLDVASAEFFASDDSFAWFEHKADGQWQRHVIDSDSGPSIQLTFAPDLYGDGVLRAVGTNHTNTQRMPPDEWESAVYVFEVPDDPTRKWPKTKVSTGIVSRPGDLQQNRYDAPGIHGIGDIDGDGDADIAVAGDGDDRVFWLEQSAPGQFTTHVLETDLGQAGGQVIADLDGDGNAEIVVTGYEDNVVYIYEYTP